MFKAAFAVTLIVPEALFAVSNGSIVNETPITCEKGGSVVRMLEQYLGEDRFRDGVRHYLTQHQYGKYRDADGQNQVAYR